MKFSKIITHPLFVIVSFMVIIISGEQMGGFYILYLLLGLSHLTPHSLTGILGIMLLLLNVFQGRKESKNQTKVFINLLGVLLLWTSLFLFFYTDKTDYNIYTFYEGVPLFMLLLFVAISGYFFVHNILSLKRHSKNDFYKPPVPK